MGDLTNLERGQVKRDDDCRNRNRSDIKHGVAALSFTGRGNGYGADSVRGDSASAIYSGDCFISRRPADVASSELISVDIKQRCNRRGSFRGCDCPRSEQHSHHGYGNCLDGYRSSARLAFACRRNGSSTNSVRGHQSSLIYRRHCFVAGRPCYRSIGKNSAMAVLQHGVELLRRVGKYRWRNWGDADGRDQKTHHGERRIATLTIDTSCDVRDARRMSRYRAIGVDRSDRLIIRAPGNGAASQGVIVGVDGSGGGVGRFTRFDRAYFQRDAHNRDGDQGHTYYGATGDAIDRSDDLG